jgi:hypothetical protein
MGSKQGTLAAKLFITNHLVPGQDSSTRRLCVGFLVLCHNLKNVGLGCEDTKKATDFQISDIKMRFFLHLSEIFSIFVPVYDLKATCRCHFP